MKKILSMLWVALSLTVLISCSQLPTEKKTDAYTITISSPQGKSVLGVSEDGLINRSVYNDAASNVTTSRKYTYDDNSRLRAVTVLDDCDNAYIITYGSEMTNTERSAINGQENTPGKVMYVSKTTLSGTRAASSTLTDVEKIEYYYDENGKLTGIMRVDTNGNVYGKGN